VTRLISHGQTVQTDPLDQLIQVLDRNTIKNLNHFAEVHQT